MEKLSLLKGINLLELIIPHIDKGYLATNKIKELTSLYSQISGTVGDKTLSELGRMGPATQAINSSKHRQHILDELKKIPNWKKLVMDIPMKIKTNKEGKIIGVVKRKAKDI